MSANSTAGDHLYQEIRAVTKKEIVRTISEEIGLTQLQTKEIVQKTFNAIVETLVEDGRIELRNFGVFEVKRRAPRKARNPRTGDKVFVPEKFVVTFKPGKEMEERVRELERQAAIRARAGAETAGSSRRSLASRPLTIIQPVTIPRQRTTFSDVGAVRNYTVPRANRLIPATYFTGLNGFEPSTEGGGFSSLSCRQHSTNRLSSPCMEDLSRAQLDFSADLGLAGLHDQRLRPSRLLGRSDPADHRTDQYLGKPSSPPGRMGAVLVA